MALGDLVCTLPRSRRPSSHASSMEPAETTDIQGACFKGDDDAMDTAGIRGTRFFCLTPREFEMDADKVQMTRIQGTGFFYPTPRGFKGDAEVGKGLEFRVTFVEEDAGNRTGATQAAIDPKHSLFKIAIQSEKTHQFTNNSERQTISMLDLNVAKELGKWLGRGGWSHFYQVFFFCLARVDLTQVHPACSYQTSLGNPLEQRVPGTCSIMASAVCVEAVHRLQYERVNGPGTFMCSVVQPTDVIGACYQHIIWRPDIRKLGRIWMPGYGADVGNALNKVMELGGFATTTLTSGQPPAAPRRLQLKSRVVNNWNEPGKELTAPRIAEILNTHGPFIGTIWVNPWYCLFDSADDSDLVYKSGCARDPVLQQESKVIFEDIPVGLHSVLVFEYRRGGKDIHVLDNHNRNGPTRWVSSEELEYVHIVSVDTVDPPFHYLPT